MEVEWMMIVQAVGLDWIQGPLNGMNQWNYDDQQDDCNDAHFDVLMFSHCDLNEFSACVRSQETDALFSRCYVMPDVWESNYRFHDSAQVALKSLQSITNTVNYVNIKFNLFLGVTFTG